MSQGLSVYLDLVRFLAALCVFVDHFGVDRLSGGLLWQLQVYGSVAVDVFFVLSGFVIAMVSSRRENTASEYAAARLGRIYSACLPALVLTFLLDWIGHSLRPGLYDWDDYSANGWPGQFLAGLSFLNESWLGHIRIGSNGPYWSLGYEVWYYAAFGCWLFAPGRWRWLGTAAALAVAGPKVAALFPIWLMGVFSYHLCQRIKLAPGWGAALIVVTLLVGPCLGLYLRLRGLWNGTTPIPERPITELGLEYLVGLGTALNFIGAWFAAPWLWRLLRPLARPIQACASVTLTLYVIHMPVLAVARAASPFASGSWANRGLLVASVVVAVVVLAEITEKRKRFWRDLFRRMLPGGQRGLHRVGESGRIADSPAGGR